MQIHPSLPYFIKFDRVKYWMMFRSTNVGKSSKTFPIIFIILLVRHVWLLNLKILLESSADSVGRKLKTPSFYVTSFFFSLSDRKATWVLGSLLGIIFNHSLGTINVKVIISCNNQTLFVSENASKRTHQGCSSVRAKGMKHLCSLCTVPRATHFLC